MIIYKLTNKIDGKKYVGQTIQSLSNRIKAHRCLKNNKCPYLKNAIAKHGFDNFEIETLATASSKEELDILEKKHIELENSLYPNGYNLRTGGQQGGPMSEESRKKLSNSCKGRIPGNKGKPGPKCSEDKKQYLSKLFSGRLPWNTGKKMPPLSEEVKKGRSDRAKAGGLNWIKAAIDASKKSIICNENGKIYSSFQEAANDLKISRISI